MAGGGSDEVNEPPVSDSRRAKCTGMPTRNWLPVSLAFEQLFLSHYLRICPVANLEPGAALSLRHYRPKAEPNYNVKITVPNNYKRNPGVFKGPDGWRLVHVHYSNRAPGPEPAALRRI